MSKNQKSVKGLENIGQVATALKAQAANAFLPDLSSVLGLAKKVQTSIEDTGLQQQRQEATSLRVEQVSVIGKTIGQALASESPEMETENISSMENGILSFFNETKVEVVKRQLARAFFTALLEAAPATSDAMTHLGTMGYLIGYLRKDPNGVILPVANEVGGRWNREGVSVPHGDEAVNTKLRAKVQELKQEQDTLFRADRDAVRDGAGELLATIAAKSGEAVFFVLKNSREIVDRETKQKKTIYDPSCFVRVRIEGEKIFPVTASGKTGSIVEQAKSLGLYLTTSQIGEGRISLPKGKILDKTEVKALLTFHSLCYRGMKLAKENALQKKQVAEMKEKATVELAEFVLRNAKGVAHLHFSEWTAGHGDEAVVYKNVDCLVERNKDGEIRVLAHLAAHEQLFKDCRDPMSALEKYAGVAYPLGNMLRKLYAILSNKERKADGDDPKPPTDPTKPSDEPKLEPEPQTLAPKEEEFRAPAEKAALAVAKLRANQAASAKPE